MSPKEFYPAKSKQLIQLILHRKGHTITMLGRIKTIHKRSKNRLDKSLFSSGSDNECSIGAEFSLFLGRINPGPWTQSVNKPVTTPTLNPSTIIKNPVTGSFASSKKAASPIVAVNVGQHRTKAQITGNISGDNNDSAATSWQGAKSCG